MSNSRLWRLRTCHVHGTSKWITTTQHESCPTTQMSKVLWEIRRGNGCCVSSNPRCGLSPKQVDFS